MRTLEEIEKDLHKAREELANVKGRTAEVYSRIVGYYRSVRNWNKGKREEYGERKLYDVEASLETAAERQTGDPTGFSVTAQTETAGNVGEKLLLFTRPACPACPQAKQEAEKLGVTVETINADTEAGLAHAMKYNVMSTPTAILLDKNGNEIERARDRASIALLGRFLAPEMIRKSA